MKAFVSKKYYLLILVNVFNSTILKWLDIFLAKFLTYPVLFFLPTNLIRTCWEARMSRANSLQKIRDLVSFGLESFFKKKTKNSGLESFL